MNISDPYSAPWHRASYDRFLREQLPQLLVSRLPLTNYQVESGDTPVCRVTVGLETNTGEGATVVFDAVPQPDAAGLFLVDGRNYVVPPIASTDELDVADIACVGEQLYALCEARIGDAPADLRWDAALLQTWLPLDVWIRDYVRQQGQAVTPPVWQARENWFALHSHLRRLVLPDHPHLFTLGHFGRTCPLETPEGPNIGRLLVVATGAEIRDGKLQIVDDSPLGSLGANARMIPFLENNDPCRLVMSANMLRQWVIPPDPEPALIQTGSEPADAPDFWCGRNLLTAYVSGGMDTFEDGILISQSCARRLSYPFDVQSGDKLSNRSGNKGVISRILPDEEMPHLVETEAQGAERRTPVELVFSPMSLYSRMTFGQVREAVLSCVARQEGQPIIVPPFQAPDSPALRERILAARLPANGMRRLSLSKDGPLMSAPTTVGWVYWGRLYHISRDKIQVTTSPTHCPRLGQAEYQALAIAGAEANIRETFNTRACDRADAATLAARLAAGPVMLADSPTPQWLEVAKRLAVGGVKAEVSPMGLLFTLAPPEGETLMLAETMRHPWNPETSLAQIGAMPALPEYGALAEANARLARMLSSQAPDSLTTQARIEVENRLAVFFAVLLTGEHLEFGARVQFSGRAVAAMGTALNYEEVGLPAEIAWELFAPLVTREMGGSEAAHTRTPEAIGVLDAILARSWVLLNRAPTLQPTGLLAFRPVRIPDLVIRVHPFACALMELDFDGDEVAVFLPITEAGQREAGERLSIAGHVRRDPRVLTLIRPLHDARLGLAHLALTSAGQTEIEQSIGTSLEWQNGLPTREGLAQIFMARLLREGTEAVAPILDTLHHLTRRGFEVARPMGGGYGPFFGSDWPAPAKPDSEDGDVWNVWLDEFAARLSQRMRQPDALQDPVLLTLQSGARGSLRMALKIAGAQGVVTNGNGGVFPIKHSYAEGLTPREFALNCIGAREGMARGLSQWFEIQREMLRADGPTGYGVLARARRAPRPGLVFARAAAEGETDPLEDRASRLFVN